jgi:hypothetical protein
MFLLLGNTALAVPPGYKEIRITDTPNEFDYYAQINDLGDIVFFRGKYDQPQTYEIWLWTDGTFERITDDSVADVFPVIDNNRVVVWHRRIGPNGPFGQTHDIARWRDGTIDILTDTDIDETGVSISPTGEILWSDVVDVGCENSPIAGIRLYREGEVIPIYDDGYHNSTPSMANDGRIIWTNYHWCGKGWYSEIMSYKDGMIEQLSNGTTPQVAQIAPNGIVAWRNDVSLVELWDEGQITQYNNTDYVSATFVNSRAYITYSIWNEVNGTWDAWVNIEGELRLLARNDVNNQVDDINEYGDITCRRGDFRATDIDIFLFQRLPYGDMNCDEKVTFDDIDGFTLALVDRATYEAAYPDCDWWLADTSGDRKVDFGDIDPFVECIIKGCER